MAGLKSVDIGPGQGRQQWPIWITLFELNNGLGATPGVQSDHQIDRGAIPGPVNADLVADIILRGLPRP